MLLYLLSPIAESQCYDNRREQIHEFQYANLIWFLISFGHNEHKRGSGNPISQLFKYMNSNIQFWPQRAQALFWKPFQFSCSNTWVPICTKFLISVKFWPHRAQALFWKPYQFSCSNTWIPICRIFVGRKYSIGIVLVYQRLRVQKYDRGCWFWYGEAKVR